MWARFDATVSPAWARYTIQELPAVEGFSALLPTAVNTRGDVVGSYVEYHCPPPSCVACSCGPYVERAFLFDGATQTARRIGNVGFAGTELRACGINDAGQVAVTADDSQRCFRWERDALTELGALSDAPSWAPCVAQSIDASGEIAGWSYVPAPPDLPGGQHAVIWAGLVPRDLGPGVVAFLSPSGVPVVGRWHYDGAAVTYQVIGLDGGVARDLAPGWSALPRAINDSGRIVGAAEPVPQEEHAFVLDVAEGALRVLDQASSFSAVNARGDAVGLLRSRSFESIGAVVWRDGELVDLTNALGDPSWVLLSATGINDGGQIVGFGTHGGEPRGFVLTPR